MTGPQRFDPLLEEIDRIAQNEDAVVRNLQITQCYHELSAVLTDRTGLSANWCTFATWASRQAGQTIRKEDFKRLLEASFRRNPAALLAAQSFSTHTQSAASREVMALQAVALDADHLTGAVERASDAVGRGNQKVFAEIGRQFARFYATCLHPGPPEPQRLDRFCEALQPGDPPAGQDYLRRAFSNYYKALYENDTKIRAELILAANVEIGYHEQTRLQPEIAESLDAGLISSVAFTRRLLSRIFPLGGWFSLAHLYLMRLLGRPTLLDRLIQNLLAAARMVLHEVITEMMMTLSLPSGEVLRLGQDLTASFPASLQQISLPELKALIDQLDPTPDSILNSGTVDWADLSDRLHFILDFFRCYQEHANLFDSPFSPEQVQALKAGKLPSGRL